jgi:hypothetical protein
VKNTEKITENLKKGCDKMIEFDALREEFKTIDENLKWAGDAL